MSRKPEDLFRKLRRHLPPDVDPSNFTDDRHWLIQRQVQAMQVRTIPRIMHEGSVAHPVRLIMEHDQPGKLHRYEHRIKNTCGFATCINPRHYQVAPNRKLIGITPRGERVYHEDRHPIPVFSWQIAPAYDPTEEILDDLEYQLGKIEGWKRTPAEQLHAQLGDPAFTVEMIRKLQP
jgi:hypothetical protein